MDVNESEMKSDEITSHPMTEKDSKKQHINQVFFNI